MQIALYSAEKFSEKTEIVLWVNGEQSKFFSSKRTSPREVLSVLDSGLY